MTTLMTLNYMSQYTLRNDVAILSAKLVVVLWQSSFIAIDMVIDIFIPVLRIHIHLLQVRITQHFLINTTI